MRSSAPPPTGDRHLPRLLRSCAGMIVLLDPRPVLQRLLAATLAPRRLPRPAVGQPQPPVLRRLPDGSFLSVWSA
jgi:hypothetical protein